MQPVVPRKTIFGSVLIIVGTSIGAGMLALPMVSGMFGFLLTFILLIMMWALVKIAIQGFRE